MKLVLRKLRMGVVEYKKWDLEKCRRNQLDPMTIIDELPFRHIEGKEFQNYSKFLESRFYLHSCHNITKDILKVLGVEKELVRKQSILDNDPYLISSIDLVCTFIICSCYILFLLSSLYSVILIIFFY